MPKKDDFFSIQFKTTADIKVPRKLVDQVIGQDKSVDVIKKAAKQGRNVFLIGDPGTGKSMLAQAMSELLPARQLVDILAYPNPVDQNSPRIVVVPAGRGQQLVREANMSLRSQLNNVQLMIFVISFIILSALSFMYFNLHMFSDVVYAAYLILAAIFFIAMALGSKTFLNMTSTVPKIIVDNSGRKNAPFVDATGARAGALLGDVKHDPLQSGGLGTPAHLRVVAGAIHKAHKGILFIDEIASLSPKSQQDLLTAMQEKKFSITGQSENSSGAMVHTEPAPCDFLLVASGNYDALKHLNPALRSRIRGYGYEVNMNTDMPDTVENRDKLARFVAQEVKKDGKIPHFSKAAVKEIVLIAKRRSGTKGKLTLRLRDLGGLIRTAGDIARERGAKVVDVKDVREATKYARTLERQIADEILEKKRQYDVIKTEGAEVGRVNGLAVLGNSDAGIVLPVEAEVAPGGEIKEIIATGGLGKIAQEAVKNVSAIVRKFFGKDLKGKYDIYVQFLQTPGGVEGDSASITVATAIISAFLGIPVRQDIAMTGSLSVRGEVLPVGGVTYKILAAHAAGIREVIIPEKNKDDLVLPDDVAKEMKIHPVSTITDVLNLVLVDSKQKRTALAKFAV